MAREIKWFSNDEEPKEVNRQIQYFSVASDLKTEKRPIRQRYRLTMQDFKQFVRAKKSTLKKDDLDLLDQMLISKFNVFINTVEPEIEKGMMLSVALGITEQNLRKSADKFAREYRKLIRARDTLGYIPRDVQVRVDDTYKEMIAELRKEVFQPVLTLFSNDPNELPHDIQIGLNPEDDEKSKTVLINGNPTLPQLYDYIVGVMRNENIRANIELNDSNIIIKLDETDDNQE